MKTKRSIQWVKPNNKISYAGVHLIAEFWGGKIIENSKKIERILALAVKEAKNTPLKIVTYKFSPRGITGVVLLAESHLAIHTWPEIDYVAIDIFTCGEKAVPERALKCLEKVFKPKKVIIKRIKRGKVS